MRKYLIILLFVPVVCCSQSKWVRLIHPACSRIDNIQFTGNDTGFIRGYSNGAVMFKTYNLGNNWTQVLLPQNFSLGNFYFLNSCTGVISGNVFFRGAIYRTTNTGQNWNLVFIEDSISGSSYYPQYKFIDFINDNFGIVSGRNTLNSSAAYKTIDGGSTWSVINSAFPTIINMKVLTFLDYIILSTGATLFRTSDGGNSWSMLLSGITDNFYDISFINESTGFVSGNNQTIIKTTNYGNNWQVVSFMISSTNNIYSLVFVSPGSGYCIKGDYSEYRIFKTENGGSNWHSQSQAFNYNNMLRKIYFLNKDTGFVVGDSIILRTFEGGGPIGTSLISNEIPEDYSLYQNYPNPFNPVTKIKFSIPKSQFVIIKIYDIVGRELTVIINEKLTAGTYSVDWDAESFPSGIYLYKIQTESFSETKKMVLTK